MRALQDEKTVSDLLAILDLEPPEEGEREAAAPKNRGGKQRRCKSEAASGRTRRPNAARSTRSFWISKSFRAPEPELESRKPSNVARLWQSSCPLSLSLVPSSRWYVEEVLPYLMNGIITSAIELSANVGGVNFSTGDGVGGLNCNENCGCGHGGFASARYVPAAQGFSEAALVRKTLSRAVVLKDYPAIPKTDD